MSINVTLNERGLVHGIGGGQGDFNLFLLLRCGIVVLRYWRISLKLIMRVKGSTMDSLQHWVRHTQPSTNLYRL
jgi:hypothetical protein